MPTLTISREHLLEAACRELRDAHGRNFFSAVSAVDHLGYGEAVAGYYGTERGRDINLDRQLGRARDRRRPSTRFKVVYHLARVGDGPPDRVRVQVLIEDGESVPSVCRFGRPPTGTSGSSTT